MKKYVNYIAAALFVMSMFAGAGIVSAQYVGQGEMVVSPMPVPGNDQELNFTKLEISPRYGNARLKPGESKEMSVTIKNKEKKPVSVKPAIVIPPYGEYMMEKEWVAVTPQSAEIPAGGSQKFIVLVTIPNDATTGYYNAQVTFTDEEIPSPYPQPIPNYVHAYQLSIDVWMPLNVQILRPYITDQLEAGNEYDYSIGLKNTADKAIAIDPRMSDQNSMYYGPFGTTDFAFTDEAITITAPKEVPAGQTVEVKVHITVPEDAKGNYNGAIDLGISDLSARDEWADMVNLQFGVWRQPSEPFVKSFTTDAVSPVTIEVSSNLLNGLLGYIGYPGTTSSSTKSPSFTVNLNGPDNKPISLTKTKTLIKGGVSLGGMGAMYPPWESESEGIYNEMGVQYVETFTATVPAGDNKLSVLPRDTQGFEYTITIGE